MNAPSLRQEDDKPRRTRAKRLTTVNRSTRLGKRIDELTALFVSAFPPDELTPLKREKIADAAQLKAIAEKARGEWMREGRGTAEDIVRLERKADHAVRQLGISEGKPRRPTLAEYLAMKREARG